MDSSLVRYRSIVTDNERWKDFEFREGDIVISTPAKCGTTWTQQICALLLFQTAELGKPLDLISPWLDQTLRPLDAVRSDLEAQTHRRFIKSHTPLDGLPWDDRVTYITVGRDPRDVAFSWDNHMNNLDLGAFLELRGKAVGNDDLAEMMPTPPDVPLDTEADRFWFFVEAHPTDENAIGHLEGTLHHLRTFWDVRDRPNVILLHYGDLKSDLEGQMRALAQRLSIEVPEERWPELVRAATFEEMKKKAADVGPNQTENIWQDPVRFFHKGTNGQWRDVLKTEDDVKRYVDRIKGLADEGFSKWLHQGTL